MTTITEAPPSPAPSTPPPPPPRSPSASRAPAIVSVVLVSVGVLLLVAGAALGGVLTRRDGAGFFHTSTGTLRSDGYAVTSEPTEFGAADPDIPATFDDLVTFRVRASAEGDGEMFIGVAARADVDRYLEGVNRDVVTEIDTNPFHASLQSVTGPATPSAPGTQTFWTASTSGSGEQELRWNIPETDSTVVVMNADGSRHVVTQASVGVRVNWLVQIAFGLAALGTLSALSGALVWFTRGRRRAR